MQVTSGTNAHYYV